MTETNVAYFRSDMTRFSSDVSYLQPVTSAVNNIYQVQSENGYEVPRLTLPSDNHVYLAGTCYRLSPPSTAGQSSSTHDYADICYISHDYDTPPDSTDYHAASIRSTQNEYSLASSIQQAHNPGSSSYCHLSVNLNDTALLTGSTSPNTGSVLSNQ